jgi:hypothetical protein
MLYTIPEIDDMQVWQPDECNDNATVIGKSLRKNLRV